MHMLLEILYFAVFVLVSCAGHVMGQIRATRKCADMIERARPSGKFQPELLPAKNEIGRLDRL
jgi:hypothetical protein